MVPSNSQPGRGELYNTDDIRYDRSDFENSVHDLTNETANSTASNTPQSSFNYTTRTFDGRFSFVQVAYLRDINTEHVQFTILRKRNSLSANFYPTYELILEEQNNKVLIIAQKMNLNRTSNYHLFDMTRGQVGSKLSKKNGNYLGKLRARNLNRTDYVLLNQNAEREELGAISYDRSSIIDQLRDGCQPRELYVIVPPLNSDSVPIPYHVGDDDKSLLDYTKENMMIPEGYHALKSKEPVYENGNYRLNFHGRVSVPSVKNFQLVSPNDIDDIICQFGKVGEDKFHLDYKAPLNAVQAFCIALSQYNL